MLLASIGALVGCAAVAPTAESRAADVKSRAEARWALLVSGELKKAYDFLSPGQRAVTTAEQYAGSIKVGLWREAKVVSADCPDESNLCKVSVNVKYTFAKGKGAFENERGLVEKWRHDDGKWWFVESE